jgi:hypothetical protein
MRDTTSPEIETMILPPDTVHVGDTLVFRIAVSDNDTLSRVDFGIINDSGFYQTAGMDTIDYATYEITFIVPQTGRYSYWYEAEDYWENFQTLPTTEEFIFVTGDYIDATDEIPDLNPFTFILHPCFPNPFNSATTVSFSLPHSQHANISIYDLTGRMVTTLADQIISAGQHSVMFDASGLPSGIYFARLTAGNKIIARKMVLLK